MIELCFVGLFLIFVVAFVNELNSREKLKIAREKAIAEELEIGIEDFVVFNFVEKDKFMGEIDTFSKEPKRTLFNYYSAENSVWLICTKDFKYEVLFKGNTDRVIYARKIERIEAVD